MKNWKCKIGLHKFETIASQTVPNVMGGVSESPLMRDILKCQRCGKKHIIGFDIGTNAHHDERLNWRPYLS